MIFCDLRNSVGSYERFAETFPKMEAADPSETMVPI
jgi:hypothetical protein